MPTKTPERKASGGKANALQKPLQPSEELAAVVGSGPLYHVARVAVEQDACLY